jgi:hypothetical protein
MRVVLRSVYNSQDADSMTMRLSKSQEDDSMTMRLSNSQLYAPPNEDFGRRNKRFRVRFRSTFQGCEYSIWATKR